MGDDAGEIIFKHKSKYGEITKLKVSDELTITDLTDFFKKFLLAVGYSPESVNENLDEDH